MILTLHLAICLLAILFAVLAAFSVPSNGRVSLGWLAVALIALALIV